MGMMSEFKEFAMKGNVVDLAVGVVIGAAFGKIVSALVDGVIMPIISSISGGVDFSKAAWVLQDAVIGPDGKEVAAAVAIKYGAFIQTIIDFTIIAFVLFLVIKAMNRLKKAEAAAPAAPAEPSEDVLLLREIRDSLKK
ncbi:large-conductance mechanosensitive channel protein MscL [Lysobacter brunescens]|uniref:Large-conductance mechanosensitive channel n=1 Tax=Lysobacter brunescens TaxID=262323 RepID=A0ABW2YEP6_9GAMM